MCTCHPAYHDLGVHAPTTDTSAAIGEALAAEVTFPRLRWLALIATVSLAWLGLLAALAPRLT
jgi:hypothetical protein